jgi:hypothetical protein
MRGLANLYIRPECVLVRANAYLLAHCCLLSILTIGIRPHGNIQDRVERLMCKFRKKGKPKVEVLLVIESLAGMDIRLWWWLSKSQSGSDNRQLTQTSKRRSSPQTRAQRTVSSVSGEGNILTTFRIRSTGIFPSPECGMNSYKTSHPPSSELPAHLAALFSHPVNHTSAGYRYRRWS